MSIQNKRKLRKSKSISLKKLTVLGFKAAIAIYFVFNLSTYLYDKGRVTVANYRANQIDSHAELIRRISTHLEIPDQKPATVFKIESEADLQSLLVKMPYLAGLEKDEYVVAYPGLVVVYDAKRDLLSKVIGATKD